MKLESDNLPVGFLVIFLVYHHPLFELRMLVTKPDHTGVEFIPFGSHTQQPAGTQNFPNASVAFVPKIIEMIETRCNRKLKKTKLEDASIQIWEVIS